MTEASTYDAPVIRPTIKCEMRNGATAKVAGAYTEVGIADWSISHQRDNLCSQLDLTLAPVLDSDGSALNLYSDENDASNPCQLLAEVKLTVTLILDDETTTDIVLFRGYITEIEPERESLHIIALDKMLRVVYSTCAVTASATSISILAGGLVTLRKVSGSSDPDELEVDPTVGGQGAGYAWDTGGTIRRSWVAEAPKLIKDGAEMKDTDYLMEYALGRISLAVAFDGGAVYQLQYLHCYEEGSNEAEALLEDALTYSKALGGAGFSAGELDLEATGITVNSLTWSISDGTTDALWRKLRDEFLPANYVFYYDARTDKIVGRYAYMGVIGAPPSPTVEAVINAKRLIRAAIPRSIDDLRTRIVIQAQKRVDKGVTDELSAGDYTLLLDGSWTALVGENDFDNLTDDRPSTRFRYQKALGGVAEGGAYVPFFSVALDAATAITSLKLTGAASKNRFAWYVWLEGSTDGSSWHDLGTGARDIRLEHDQVVSISSGFVDTPWSYIRVSMKPCKDFARGAWRSVSLAELHIFGSTALVDSSGDPVIAKIVASGAADPDINAPTAVDKSYYTVGYLTELVSALSVLGISTAKVFAQQYLNERIRIYQRLSVAAAFTTEVHLWSYITVVDPWNIHAASNELDLLVEEYTLSADTLELTGTDYSADIIGS